MNHYTYMIEGMSKKYIGVRTCKCDPIEDVDYFGSSKYLKEAIKENGKDKFSKQILAIFGTRTHAMEYEIALHNHFDVGRSPLFWNRAKQKSTGFDVTGTKLGYPSEETRRKMSEANKGKNHPMYGKKGKNCPNYGLHHTEETRKKMSESRKGKNNPMYGRRWSHTEESKLKISESVKGKNHPMYGKRHTEETRKKMSEALKGKNHPMYGKKHTAESKQKMFESKGNIR